MTSSEFEKLELAERANLARITTNVSILGLAVTDLNDVVRTAYASNPAVSGDALDVAFYSQDLALMQGAASNLNAKPFQLIDTVQQGQMLARINAASNPNAPEAALLLAVKENQSIGVRLAALRNPKLTPACIELLLADRNINKDFKFSELYKFISSEQIINLFVKPKIEINTSITHFIVQNKNFDAETIRKCYQISKKSKYTCRPIILCKNTPDDILLEIFTNYKEQQALIIATHPNSFELQQLVLKLPIDSKARTSYIETTTDLEKIKEFFKSDLNIQVHVTANPNCSKEQLHAFFLRTKDKGLDQTLLNEGYKNISFNPNTSEKCLDSLYKYCNSPNEIEGIYSHVNTSYELRTKFCHNQEAIEKVLNNYNLPENIINYIIDNNTRIPSSIFNQESLTNEMLVSLAYKEVGRVPKQNIMMSLMERVKYPTDEILIKLLESINESDQDQFKSVYCIANSEYASEKVIFKAQGLFFPNFNGKDFNISYAKIKNIVDTGSFNDYLIVSTNEKVTEAQFITMLTNNASQYPFSLSRSSLTNKSITSKVLMSMLENGTDSVQLAVLKSKYVTDDCLRVGIKSEEVLEYVKVETIDNVGFSKKIELLEIACKNSNSEIAELACKKIEKIRHYEIMISEDDELKIAIIKHIEAIDILSLAIALKDNNVLVAQAAKTVAARYRG